MVPSAHSQQTRRVVTLAGLLALVALSLALSALQPVHQFVLIIEDPATDFDPRRTDILFVPSQQASLSDPQFRSDPSLADQTSPIDDDFVVTTRS